jgi:hypothetical protein
MNKLLLATIILIITLTSCSKDYTCTCNVTAGTVGGATGVAFTAVETINSSYPKDHVQNECNIYGESYIVYNGTYKCTVQ